MAIENEALADDAEATGAGGKAAPTGAARGMEHRMRHNGAIRPGVP